MALLAVIVDGGDLLMTIAASFVAGLGIAFVSSIGIWGGARYVDLNQDGRTIPAICALAVGVLGLLGTIGIIVLGLYMMIAG